MPQIFFTEQIPTTIHHPNDEPFTHDPNLIFDASVYVQLWCFDRDKDGNPEYFLVFGRRRLIPAPDGYESNTNGMMWGWEIAAYRCDENGKVRDWFRRYESEGAHLEAVINKLRFSYVNFLATLSNYED